MYTVAARKNTLEDISAASLTLYDQNFASATERNVVRKFTNRFSWTSLPIDSVGQCMRYSPSQIFPCMGRIQGHIRENSHILPSLTYFTY